MKNDYDSRIIKSHKSADTIRLKRIRRFALLGWLVFSLLVGIVVYKVYGEKKLSDTPSVAIESDTGVSTGLELEADKEFGPWD